MIRNLTLLAGAVVLLCCSGALFAQQEKEVSLFNQTMSLNQEQQTSLQGYMENGKFLILDQTAFDDVMAAKHYRLRVDLPSTDFGNMTLNVERFEIFSDDAQTMVSTDDGLLPIDFRKNFVAYKGTINGDPNSLVTLTFSELGVLGFMKKDDESYVIASMFQNEAFQPEQHIFYRTSDLLVSNSYSCGTEMMEIPARVQEMIATVGDGSRNFVEGPLLEVEMALETDWETHNAYGGAEGATAYIVSVMTTVSAVYILDVGTKITVVFTNVWETSSDPYSGDGSGDFLNQFRNYWNANFREVDRDLAHMISTRPGGLGGVAWLDVLCSNLINGFGYGFSNTDGSFPPLPGYSWDIDVTAHETGHNYGSLHTHNCSWSPPIDTCVVLEENEPCRDQAAPKTGTIMSYCHLTSSGKTIDFHPQVIDVIRTEAENAACVRELDNQLLIAYPNGGEIIGTEQSFSLIWGAGFEGTVNLDYSLDNGANWAEIVTDINAGDQTYTWTTPAIATTEEALIRVSDATDPAEFDISDLPFTIRARILGYALMTPENNSTYRFDDQDEFDFVWSKAGNAPGITYEMALTIFQAGFPLEVFQANGSGVDTVLTLSEATIDSFLTANDAWMGSDSIKCRWSVKARLGSDSLTTGIRFISFKPSTTGIETVESSTLPTEFAMEQNYPNPFNPSTDFKFQVADFALVRIAIYDIQGRLVNTVVDREMAPGSYSASWDGRSDTGAAVASGVYVYRMTAGSFLQTRKMILLK